MYITTNIYFWTTGKVKVLHAQYNASYINPLYLLYELEEENHSILVGFIRQSIMLFFMCEQYLTVKCVDTEQFLNFFPFPV